MNSQIELYGDGISPGPESLEILITYPLHTNVPFCHNPRNEDRNPKKIRTVYQYFI